jgi:hypothetical protein
VKRLPSTLLAVGLSAWCTLAHAQALTPQEEANARFQAGLKYYDARDFESARLAFTQAYAVMQKPGILLNLGLSEIYSGHYVEGLDHLDAWLKDPSTPSEKKERAKKGYDEGYKKTGHLVVRTASGAEVKIDGKALPSGVVTAHVVPGPHKVEARLADKSKSVDTDAPAGVERTVELAFESAPLAPAPPSSNGAATPPVDGSHVEPPREEPKASFWDTPRFAGLALFAVGVGGVAAGVVFGSSSNSDKDKADGLRAQLQSNSCAGASPPAICRDLKDARDSQDKNATLSTVFVVSGGVVAAAGAAVFLFWPHHKNVQVAPTASAHDVGLLMTGHF